jgi:thiol-disulfide isomerase/thioredoxin
MGNLKKYLPWIIRFLIFALFIVSGIAKMFPIWAFEKQLVDLGVASWCTATYLARAIIALEIALGVAILQSNYIKKLVIPATIALLAAFCVHLSIEMYKHGAMNGNCGCFGQLIPMTPLEAFVKNIITILLLIYLYKNVADKPSGMNKFSNLLIIFLASNLLLFTLFPFAPCSKDEAKKEDVVTYELPTSNSDSTIEVEQITAQTNIKDTVKTSNTIITKTNSKKDSIKSTPKLNPAPISVKSKFSTFPTFNGQQIKIDEGKKVICCFAPGCDHCREAAKELCAMSKKPGFPPIYIYFMDEEADLIPAFFKEAGCMFPYQVMDVRQFWKLLGQNASTPVVSYLWNGNIQKTYQGIEDEKFDPIKFEAICLKE